MLSFTRAAVLAGGVGLTLATMAGPAHATDYGPPPDMIHVSCNEVWIDPPAVTWVQVHLMGDFDGVPTGETVSYGAPVPHKAQFPLTLAKIKGPGVHHYTFVATWSLGAGYSQVSKGDISCDEPATTTTTVQESTTVPVMPPHVSPTTLRPLVRIGTAVSVTAAPAAHTAPQELPRTGAITWPLAAIGAGLLAAGALLSKMHGR